MLLEARVKQKLVTFTTFDQVLTTLKSNDLSNLEKGMLAKKAALLITAEDLDVDIKWYYAIIFSTYYTMI